MCGDLGQDLRHGIVDGNVASFVGCSVLDLDDAIGEASPNDDDRGNSDQFGVLELHAGRRRLSVVEEHPHTCGLEFLRHPERCCVELGILTRRDDMNVSRRN